MKLYEKKCASWTFICFAAKITFISFLLHWFFDKKQSMELDPKHLIRNGYNKVMELCSLQMLYFILYFFAIEFVIFITAHIWFVIYDQGRL